MKKLKILYLTVNILFAGFMIFSAIPDIMVVPDAVALVSTKLGYPEYFIRYIGVAKLLGAVVLLVPGIPRLKEWAYAGLLFDLISATYSIIAVGTPLAEWWPMLLFVLLGAGAYLSYRSWLRTSEERLEIAV